MKKGKLIIYILISGIIISCSSTMDCKKFKTGTYIYYNTKAENYKYLIVRNGDTQVEFNIHEKIKITNSIQWISGCKYILTYKNVENYPKKNDVIGKKIISKIVHIEDNEIIITANGEISKNQQLKLIKISDNENVSINIDEAKKIITNHSKIF